MTEVPALGQGIGEDFSHGDYWGVREASPLPHSAPREFRWKRTLDLGLALLLLPLLVPIIALLWALVRLDGGVGFFGQARIGRSGKQFTCWKLRTMVPDAERVLHELCASDPAVATEWEATQKLRNDPRITTVGRFLRRTSLDELPQIWNILKGEMSFVGPRPFTPDQLDLYTNMAGSNAYFQMRPGLTGPWQISKNRGQGEFVFRVDFDSAYWRDQSLVYDIKIIMLTALAVTAGKGQ